MSRFDHMQTFVRVVETGGISAAAERMGVAKSAVSRRLAELEARLGAQLFRRTTRRMNLTDTGRSYYERCVRILADVEEAEAAVCQEQGTLRGRLRVAAPVSFGLLHMGPAITDFMEANPEVEFDLDFNDRQVDLIQEGIDVAIRIARLEDSSLIARRLWATHSALCASPSYLERHGTPQTPEALIDHPCLVYSNLAEPNRWQYRTPDDRPGSVTVRPHLWSNNGEFLRQATVAGLGITVGPTFLLYDAVARGELVPILREYRWPSLNAYAVYPQTRHLSRRVRAFVDFIAERFSGLPYWDIPFQATRT